MGFSLAEVKQIVNLRRAGNEPCDCVTEMIERNLATITSRIAELSRLRHHLVLTKAVR
jgi:DNA-binding transcriptional MerR regulator